MITKKHIGIGLFISALIVTFILQNTAIVNLHFLFWKVSMSRSLMIFLVLLAGMLVGWIAAGYLHKKR